MTASEAIKFAKANSIKLTVFQQFLFAIGHAFEQLGIATMEVNYTDDNRNDTYIIVVDSNDNVVTHTKIKGD